MGSFRGIQESRNGLPEAAQWQSRAPLATPHHSGPAPPQDSYSLARSAARSFALTLK